MKLGGVRWEFLKCQGGVRQTICPLTLCQSAWIFFSVLFSQDDDYHENRPDTLQLHIKRHPNMTFNGWIKLVHDWPLHNSRIYSRSLLLQEFFLELYLKKPDGIKTQEVDKITKPLIHFCCILIWSNFSQRSRKIRQQKHSIHVMIWNGL